MTPDVSVVIPVWNRPLLIREAVDSVRREQGSVALEIIVVDDASSDGTWDVVRGLEDVRAFRMDRNGGQGIARNRGLDESRGAYVKFLDSDDVLRPGHLAKEVGVARETGADIVVSGWMEVDAAGRSREYPAPRFDDIPDAVVAGAGVPTAAALYRRDPAWRWDPSFRKLDDWDYLVRAALDSTRVATAEGAAYEWRAHAGARLTDASMLENAREQQRILRRIEDGLRSDGRLTTPRRLRLAQYFYKELRVLCLHDRIAFEEAVKHIRELDPHFAPRDEERQWWMRVAARILGTRRAVLLHSAVKRAVRSSRAKA